MTARGVKVRYLEAGYCEHPEKMVIQNGAFQSIRFPATVAVIEHPTEGIILFDTGYSPAFYEQTKYFPEKFYALITPVKITKETTALAQIQMAGIHEKDIRRVILSHFHADHVAAVGDFKKAKYVYMQSGYENLKRKNRLGQLKAGFLGGLLPFDFEDRSDPIRLGQFKKKIDNLGQFKFGYDLFGDSTVVAIELPGHAEGHMGLLLRTDEGQTQFLVADAAWLTKSFTPLSFPSLIAGLLFQDRKKYKETLTALYDLHLEHPEIQIIPCHCATAYANCKPIGDASA